ncbi:hypothetical protein SAMN05192558_11458 [Actinokineospora alba]|uniref:PPE family protein n=1 Tax=Actinokineospora alba TaxID=504798 RepID=A0A1H0VIB3_9PSEU|nr:hypothetical protein [Actinokineospora alba]TDP67701.1 hypothetical protein C8E96_3251 [Actinokineospora alba]SDJ27949.1 hypothetical protein SAMN05421871_11258 [Actinokineospora alba]SDP78190.1 hypothetical protein SAMN05192558_11458 [Actinokineospora alba]
MTEPQSPLNATEDWSPANLIKPPNFDSPTQSWDGSGLFGSAANIVYDGMKGDWGALAGDAVGGGLDLLGFAMDPLGTVLSGVIGWLIEHIGFLKEPLDFLAGDPDAITAMAQTWTNIATRMQQTAEAYTNSLKAVAGTNGAAIAAYQASVNNFAQVVAGGATHAQNAAAAVTVAAEVVGVVRGVVRDAISEFASNAIIKFAAASALTPITFGASQAAFIADTVVEGAVLAGKNAKKVAKVVKKLDGFADDAKRSRNILKSTTEGLDKGVRKYVQDVADVAGKNARDVKKVVAGKADPKILENVGKRADELKAARKALPADPALSKYVKMGYRDQFGSNNPMLDRIGDKFERTGTIGGVEVSLPTVPGLIADATVQATSDQTHRESDARAKQAEKDEKWDEHWERERTKARGSDGSTVSETQPWRAEGTL